MMNKRAWIIGTCMAMLAMLLPCHIQAQRVYEPHFSLGAKAGATLSKMSFSPSVKQGWKTGFMGGVMARYTEENHFGIIAELNIAQQGWKENFEEYNNQFSYQRTLTYIELPLLTHIYFGSPKFKGFFNAGPQVGYMISSTTKANFNYMDKGILSEPAFTTRSTEQMGMEIKNRFDYGISVGLGCEFGLKSKQSAMVEARLYYGLGNIFPCTKRDYFSAARGMSIELTAGWWFNLK